METEELGAPVVKTEGPASTEGPSGAVVDPAHADVDMDFAADPLPAPAPLLHTAAPASCAAEHEHLPGAALQGPPPLRRPLPAQDELWQQHTAHSGTQQQQQQQLLHSVHVIEGCAAGGGLPAPSARGSLPDQDALWAQHAEHERGPHAAVHPAVHPPHPCPPAGGVRPPGEAPSPTPPVHVSEGEGWAAASWGDVAGRGEPVPVPMVRDCRTLGGGRAHAPAIPSSTPIPPQLQQPAAFHGVAVQRPERQQPTAVHALPHPPLPGNLPASAIHAAPASLSPSAGPAGLPQQAQHSCQPLARLPPAGAALILPEPLEVQGQGVAGPGASLFTPQPAVHGGGFHYSRVGTLPMHEPDSPMAKLKQWRQVQQAQQAQRPSPEIAVGAAWTMSQRMQGGARDGKAGGGTIPSPAHLCPSPHGDGGETNVKEEHQEGLRPGAGPQGGNPRSAAGGLLYAARAAHAGHAVQESLDAVQGWGQPRVGALSPGNAAPGVSQGVLAGQPQGGVSAWGPPSGGGEGGVPSQADRAAAAAGAAAASTLLQHLLSQQGAAAAQGAGPTPARQGSAGSDGSTRGAGAASSPASLPGVIGSAPEGMPLLASRHEGTTPTVLPVHQSLPPIAVPRGGGLSPAPRPSSPQHAQQAQQVGQRGGAGGRAGSVVHLAPGSGVSQLAVAQGVLPMRTLGVGSQHQQALHMQPVRLLGQQEQQQYRGGVVPPLQVFQAGWQQGSGVAGAVAHQSSSAQQSGMLQPSMAQQLPAQWQGHVQHGNAGAAEGARVFMPLDAQHGTTGAGWVYVPQQGLPAGAVLLAQGAVPPAGRLAQQVIPQYVQQGGTAAGGVRGGVNPYCQP